MTPLTVLVLVGLGLVCGAVAACVWAFPWLWEEARPPKWRGWNSEGDE